MATIIFKPITRNICNILINRPSKRNALNLESIKNLKSALQEFDEDEKFKVAILSGAEGNFCAGYDLNELVDTRTGMANIQQIEQMLWPLGTRLSTKKISIAAIDGHAAGFGFELALKCDFRVIEKDSRLGFLNRRFGIPIMNGGTVILPGLIGMARSLELVATGKAQLAPEALQYGTVTYVSDIGCSMGRALNLARNLSKFDTGPLLHDIKNLTEQRESQSQLLHKERTQSLEFLRQSGPLEVAVRFLKGELCRHGNTDLGNLRDPMPEVSL